MLGLDVGRIVGALVGLSVGAIDGLAEGTLLGVILGLTVGLMVGAFDGALEGVMDGFALGLKVGALVGAFVGGKEGSSGALGALEGCRDGLTDGAVGCALGRTEGAATGFKVGARVGAAEVGGKMHRFGTIEGIVKICANSTPAPLACTEYHWSAKSTFPDTSTMGVSTWAEILQVPLAGADSCSAAVAFAAKISFQLASRRYARSVTSVWSLGLVCTFTRPDTDPSKCSWTKSSNAWAEKYLYSIA